MSAPAQFPHPPTPPPESSSPGRSRRPGARQPARKNQVSGNRHGAEQPGRRAEELLELAALPFVSVRFGQPASHIDAAAQVVSTADGMEFSYDQLVIATGSAPVHSPVEGSAAASTTPRSMTPPGSATRSRRSPGSLAGGRSVSSSAPEPPPGRPRRCSVPVASGRSAPPPGLPPLSPPWQAPYCPPPGLFSMTAAA